MAGVLGRDRSGLVVRVAAAMLLVAATTVAAPSQAAGRGLAPAQIDAIAQRAMGAFHVPGMAVGVVKDGRLIYAKGFGVRELGQTGAVDAKTQFQIGSNTKAFTAAALAILVDEGKVRWDDRVIDYLPDFRLYDPYVTREFTIRDLLTHRSGLGPGAGDLMFYPKTDFTRAEIIHGLRYLKPVSGFRAQYDYDNLLYMVAGQVVAAASGESWETFVEERILKALGMSGCAAAYDRLPDRTNVATPHTLVEGRLRPIPVEDITVIGPAGTINCNVSGMARWLETQLADGAAPDGRRLFSADRGAEMGSLNTPEQVDPLLAALTGTHFKGYGLGWELQDEFGFKRVSHTGGVPGMVTWVAMIPEQKLGVVVLTNVDSGSAMEAVGNQILDAYVGAPKRDLVALLSARQASGAADADTATKTAFDVAVRAGPPPLPLSSYAGRYVDPWRGEATIREADGRLVLKFSRTDELEGVLLPYSGDVFLVRWKDRALDADAYVRFEQTFGRDVAGFTMKAISPATDFSFDFQDLAFRKLEADPRP